MRYRLRTLLIVIAVCGLVLARCHYLKRKAEYHRQRASHLIISYIAKVEDGKGCTRESIELAMKEVIELCPDEAAEAAAQSPTGDDWGYGAFGSAIKHEMIARRYDSAVFRPWIVVSEHFDP
jgi:hypothetical protein